MNINRLGLSDIQCLAELLGCDPALLQTITSNKPRYYGSFFRKKADGGKREITPPREPLLFIQRRLKHHFNSKLKWTHVVHGGVADRSTISNALPHVGKHQVVNLDISSFFPSVKPECIRLALVRAGCAAAVAPLLSELVSYKDGLPQGSPTSTIIGNLVLEPMDSDFMALCGKHGFVYTRYVDDITISGNIDINPWRQGLIDIVRRAGFDVAAKKIRFSNHSDRQVVTGLVVNTKLRPTKDYISELRGTIRRCWPENEGLAQVADENGLQPGEMLRMLRGQVGYVKSVDKPLGRGIRGLMVKILKKPTEVKSVSIL